MRSRTTSSKSSLSSLSSSFVAAFKNCNLLSASGVVIVSLPHGIATGIATGQFSTQRDCEGRREGGPFLCPDACATLAGLRAISQALVEYRGHLDLIGVPKGVHHLWRPLCAAHSMRRLRL